MGKLKPDIPGTTPLDPSDDALFESAEECFERVKPALDALTASDTKTPNIDVQQAAVIVLGVNGLLRAPDTYVTIKALAKAGVVDLALLDGLADIARAAWFTRYRLLQVSATHSDAVLPPPLAEESGTLRGRMLKTLEYNLEGDKEAMDRIAAIRAGSGHQDLANDLLAAADLYRERKGDIEHDKKNYRKGDEADARRLADRILRLIGAITTPDQTLWKRYQARAFTLLLRHYEEARRVGLFLFYYEEGERLFPSLFSAARSAPAPRGERAKTDAAGGEGPSAEVAGP